LRARVSRPYLRARVNRMGIPATLVYYTGKLGFACLGTWQDPPVYAIVARDHQVIHFRCADPPTANPDKYGLSSRTQSRCLRMGVRDLLWTNCSGFQGLYLQTLSKRAYLVVEDADALYAEYAAQGVEFTRALGNMPWHKREFVVKDCDGRLLAFGANL